MLIYVCNVLKFNNKTIITINKTEKVILFRTFNDYFVNILKVAN